MIRVNTKADKAAGPSCGMWSIIPGPNVGSNSNFRFGVARVPGFSNVWAVRSFSNSSGIGQTLTEFFS